MALTYSRPMPARQIEARSRAKTKGVRVEVVDAGRYYTTRSLSRPGLVHHIGRSTQGWQCSCEGYTYTGCCQHIAQVERRSEREGWGFGRIAPIA